MDYKTVQTSKRLYKTIQNFHNFIYTKTWQHKNVIELYTESSSFYTSRKAAKGHLFEHVSQQILQVLKFTIMLWRFFFQNWNNS